MLVSSQRLLFTDVSDRRHVDVVLRPIKPAVVVGRAARSLEPLDAIEQDELESEARLFPKQMLSGYRAVEIVSQQHRDVRYLERQCVRDKGDRQLAATAFAVWRIADDRIDLRWRLIDQ